jgi:hypothetical protein
MSIVAPNSGRPGFVDEDKPVAEFARTGPVRQPQDPRVSA